MRYIFIIFVLIVGISVSAFATTETDEEKLFHVREAFIYNFLKFVQWPKEHPYSKTSEATICIVGDHPFVENFVQQTRHLPPNLRVNVQEPASDNILPNCTILFIGQDAQARIPSLLSYTPHHPILTVSEADKFVDNGGIIEIVMVGKGVGLFRQDRINLRINLKKAESCGLNIDARLLQIAAEVIQ